jgi:hypothetical protein
MCDIEAGDLVAKRGERTEMLVIGMADDDPKATAPAFFCVWEQENILFEEIVPVDGLDLVRKERRRIFREGVLNYPNAGQNRC